MSGNPYLPGGGGGNPYLGGSGGSGSEPKKKRGGIIGTVEHVVEQTGSDLVHDAINAPAGVYQLGKGLATHPVKTVKAVAKSTADDFRHPLRHPGNTLLDLTALLDAGASLAGRAALAGKALEEGGTIADVAKAAAKKPTYGERTLKIGDLEVHPETSRSAVGSALQKLHDKTLTKAAAKTPGGKAETLLQRKVGKVVNAEAQTAERLAKGPAAALIKIGSKLKPAEQKALQVVAEQAPLEERITATAARVTGAKNVAERARHQAELDLLHQAKPHLTETAGKPALSDVKLQKVYEKLAKVAGDRETLLKGLGLLSDEAVASRTAKAGRAAIGQPLQHAAEAAPAIKGQLSLIDEAKPDLFTPDENAVRIPDVATKAPKSAGSFGRVGAQGTIGKLKAPGSVTHEYSGALREHALRREDTTRLVGESSLEASKLAGLKHIHEFVRRAVTPEPGRADDIAVRLDEMGPNERTPLEVKQLLADPEDFFGKASPSEAATALEKIRSHLFINPRTLDPQAAAEFKRLADQGKIGWVPRRILGDLAKPQAPLGAVAGRSAVKTADAINNASRFAILYLKPAYAIPNLLGNLAVNILQQGFAAPANLARAARADAKLGPEYAARIDTAMGEGVARAVSAHGQGKLAGVVDKAAGGWGKVVDTPFRRASFFYEARQAGFKTPDDLKALLTDDAHHADLVKISQKANREAIDYENLTPVEKEIVRRVVFFYPWVKGSTTYAGRFVREHPVKAAVTAELGKQGAAENLRELGPVPSYLEGVFKAGGGLVNPNSAAILQTPAQVAQAVAGLASGDRKSVV